MEKYGLTEKETELLKSAFEKFSQVETVFIYGSRAKNTFRKTSDIDLAVRFKNGNDASMAQLKSELDDLPIIHEIDLTDESKIQSGDFKNEYERTKQIFYLKGWKTTTLGEVLNIKNGKSRPKNGKIYPVYGGNGVLGYADEYNVDEEIIIIGRVGAYCGCIYFENKKFWLSDNALGVLANENSNIKFLYYLLKQLNLNKQAIGGAQPLLTQGLINQIEVIVPKSIEEQRAIAAVLSSLDDKIELLREQNKTLEATAQAIFKEWFVNFNFPGANGKMIDSELGKIPEGWQVGRLSDIIIFEGGAQPPKSEHIYEPRNGYIRFIQNRDYSTNSHITYIKENRKNKICDVFDIMMDKYGDVGVPRWGLVGAYNVALAKIIPQIKNSREYLRSYFSQRAIFSLLSASAQASTRGSLNEGTFKGIDLVIPDENTLELFENLQFKVLNKVLFNNSQIQTISTLRNLLLPKLMKGELRVKI